LDNFHIIYFAYYMQCKALSVHLALAFALETEVERHRQSFAARRVKETIARTGASMQSRNQDGTRVRGE